MFVSKATRVLLLAILATFLAAAAAFATVYTKPIVGVGVHVGLDHCTFSTLTADYKAQYTGGATRFGFIRFGKLNTHAALGRDPVPSDSGTLTISTLTPFTIRYVDPQYRHDEDMVTIGRMNQYYGSETFYANSQLKWTYFAEGGIYGQPSLRTTNDMGWFAVCMGDAETALSGASYSVNLNSVGGGGNFDTIISTAEQLRSRYVPYVELQLDAARKNAVGISWRPVDASDPNRQIVVNANDPKFDGVFGKHDGNFYLFIELNRSNGDGWSAGSKNGNLSFASPSGSATFASPIPLEDIESITFDDDGDWYWFFYPPTNGNGNAGNNDGIGGSTSTVIDPGSVTGIATGGSTIGGVVCDNGNRPTPSDLNDKNTIAGSSKIKNFNIIRTISVTVDYNRRNILPGGKVRIDIPGFRYPNPKGKLFALAKAIDGIWNRFPITQNAAGISFEIDILGYFSAARILNAGVVAMENLPTDISIADIEDEEDGPNNGGGGGGCDTVGLTVIGLAVLALIKFRA